MKRREFLNWVGVGGVASFLPMAIAACTPSGESTTEVLTTPGNFETVGTVSELETQGQILNENFQNGAISVTRNPENAELLYAVNPTCTHKGCLVDWNAGERKYICPCHGTEYSPDGTLLKGPAEENLPPYLVKIEGDQVLVQGI